MRYSLSFPEVYFMQNKPNEAFTATRPNKKSRSALTVTNKTLRATPVDGSHPPQVLTIRFRPLTAAPRNPEQHLPFKA